MPYLPFHLPNRGDIRGFVWKIRNGRIDFDIYIYIPVIHLKLLVRGFHMRDWKCKRVRNNVVLRKGNIKILKIYNVSL